MKKDDEETKARDSVLEALRQKRSELVKAADELARRICARVGEVSGTLVLGEMPAYLEQNRPALLPAFAKADPRFMGAVFRTGRWRRLRWTSDAPHTASHKRPVSVWVPAH